MSDYIIYGSAISAFTRKLEAAFQCYGAPYRLVRKTAEIKVELETRSGTHQVPVLRTPENWLLSDTTPIMMLMDSRYPNRRLFPLGANGVLVHILEEVLDEWMARTMVHYRWHYDENTVYVMSQLRGEQLDVEAARQQQLAQWGLRSCRATGTESVTQQFAAEKEYMGIIRALEEQLSGSIYALGNRPTAVDAILMGTYRGHTDHDPIPDLSEFTNVSHWNKQDHAANLVDSTINPFEQSSPFVEHLLTIAREQYAPFILGNRKAIENNQKSFVVDTYGEAVSYLCRPYPERSRRLVVSRIAHELNRDEQALVLDWLKANALDACFAPD